MDRNTLLMRVMMLVPLWLSLTVHEFFHGWSAYKLGDPTAKENGRLTLNPLAHINFIGTFALPLLGVPFGWAKPVPVNPARFDRKWTVNKGMMITAAAGPISNLLISIVAAISIGVIIRFDPTILYRMKSASSGFGGGLSDSFFYLFQILMQLNVALAIFNLIPVYPLDGSRIATGLMPRRFLPKWEKFCRYSPFILCVLIFVGAEYIIQPPMRVIMSMLLKIVQFIVGI